MDQIHPVLLCGGSGTRLWPLSRARFPKQFARIIGEKSLFQTAAERLQGAPFTSPWVITGHEFRFVVTEQLAACEIAAAGVLIEPAPRNTGPAILAAAFALEARAPGSLMLVAPSDHIINDADSFRAAVIKAMPCARRGDIVTFGITPHRPETGYGYLALAEGSDPRADEPQSLAGFVEKPQLALAQKMLTEGGYLWNAGIYLMRSDVLIAAVTEHCPRMIPPVQAAVKDAVLDLGFTRLNPSAWHDAPDISIDYAVMEKVAHLAVMPYHGGWSDLGGWDAVWAQSAPDGQGNVTSDYATAIDCRDSYLRSETERIALVGIGLDDIMAVATSDAVLVAHRSQAQRVREAVAALKARSLPQASAFSHDRRPWGWYETLVTGPRFQVKRIHVKPGAALSLQSHHHRSEHWIVVAGTAKVTLNDQVHLVYENESIHIPIGARHRLENPGKVEVVLIEVQTGAYLGEDDIIRYEDLYARG